MTRPFRQQIDAGILDRAAAIFARRGFAKTSVQDVADAVGLSKAGLLHHFPSKEQLHDAVLAQSDELGGRLLDAVEGLPPGPDRDRRAVEVVVDIALAHPGVVSLLLTPITADPGQHDPTDAAAAAMRAFGVDPEAVADTDPERVVRVIGALAGLAVLALAAVQEDLTTAWRPLMVATALDTLGHRSTRTPAHPSMEA